MGKQRLRRLALTLIAMLLCADFAFAQSLKEVATWDEYHRIERAIENCPQPCDENALIEGLGYDPISWMTFPYRVSDTNHGRQPQLPRLSWRMSAGDWVSLSMEDLCATDEHHATGTVIMKNNKSLFMQVSNVGGTKFDILAIQNATGGDVLLFPKETRQFAGIPIAGEVSSASTLEIVFDRGNLNAEFSEMNLLALLASLGLGPVGTPFNIEALPQIHPSNQAVFYSVMNIYWTAITGEWWDRRWEENVLNGVGVLLERIPEEARTMLEPFGGEFSPEVVRVIANRGIDPATFVKNVLQLIVEVLRNPFIGREAYDILVHYLPAALTQGGYLAMAERLSSLLLLGFRVVALSPITYDVLTTLNITDLSRVDVFFSSP